jgi:Zn-dependent protease
MSDQPHSNLWLRPSPDDDDAYERERDPYGAGSADDFRAPPEPERSPDPEPSHDPFGERRLKRGGGGIAALGLLIFKFFAKIKVVLLLLPKLKILTTSGSMLVSVGAYSLIWGWRFALGFVVLLFVHEMGHVIQLRREGIKASAPVFIPFLGAAVWAKSLGDNAVAEARVGLAGPVLGSIGAAACIPIANATGNDFWRALAFTGFFLNLFNLLPVVPLDGGRAMAAMSPWMWALGLFGVVVLAFTYPNPIIVLIALLAVMETWRRWRALKSGDESVRSYYRVPPLHRALVAAVYLGLIAALVLGMDATHVARTFADA